MEIAIGVILILVSIFLIVAVLFQSSKNARLSGAIAGSAETFFGKAKGKTIDKKLNTLTIVVGIVFAVIVLVLYAIQPGKAKIEYDYDFLDDYINGEKDVVVSETEDDEHDHDHDHADDDKEEADDDKDAADDDSKDDTSDTDKDNNDNNENGGNTDGTGDNNENTGDNADDNNAGDDNENNAGDSSAA